MRTRTAALGSALFFVSWNPATILLVVIIGQSLLLGQVSLLIYAAVMWCVTAAFVSATMPA